MGFGWVLWMERTARDIHRLSTGFRVWRRTRRFLASRGQGASEAEAQDAQKREGRVLGVERRNYEHPGPAVPGPPGSVAVKGPSAKPCGDARTGAR